MSVSYSLPTYRATVQGFPGIKNPTRRPVPDPNESLEILELLINSPLLPLHLSISNRRSSLLTPAVLAPTRRWPTFSPQILSVQLVPRKSWARGTKCRRTSRRTFISMSIQLSSHLFVLDHHHHPNTDSFIAAQQRRTVDPSRFAFHGEALPVTSRGGGGVGEP